MLQISVEQPEVCQAALKQYIMQLIISSIDLST